MTSSHKELCFIKGIKCCELFTIRSVHDHDNVREEKHCCWALIEWLFLGALTRGKTFLSPPLYSANKNNLFCQIQWDNWGNIYFKEVGELTLYHGKKYQAYTWKLINLVILLHNIVNVRFKLQEVCIYVRHLIMWPKVTWSRQLEPKNSICWWCLWRAHEGSRKSL